VINFQAVAARSPIPLPELISAAHKMFRAYRRASWESGAACRLRVVADVEMDLFTV